jgi:hypothetical protein
MVMPCGGAKKVFLLSDIKAKGYEEKYNIPYRYIAWQRIANASPNF